LVEVINGRERVKVIFPQINRKGKLISKQYRQSKERKWNELDFYVVENLLPSNNEELEVHVNDMPILKGYALRR